MHLQCAWRVVGPSGIVVASRDRYTPAGDRDQDCDGWDWTVQGANRCDERMAGWLDGTSYLVTAATADPYGGMRLTLARGFALEVFPDDSLPGDHWRVFQPGVDGPHFVVTGAGVEQA